MSILISFHTNEVLSSLHTRFRLENTRFFTVSNLGQAGKCPKTHPTCIERYIRLLAADPRPLNCVLL